MVEKISPQTGLELWTTRSVGQRLTHLLMHRKNDLSCAGVYISSLGTTLEGKNLLLGSKSFSLRVTPYIQVITSALLK